MFVKGGKGHDKKVYFPLKNRNNNEAIENTMVHSMTHKNANETTPLKKVSFLRQVNNIF